MRRHHNIAPSIALVMAAAAPAWAQFEMPPPRRPDAAPAAPQRLTYQYYYGMESPFTLRRDSDLDRGLKDNTLLFKTKVFAGASYRPTDWLTATLEMKLGREWPLHERDPVELPSGELKPAKKREPTLLVEQLLLTARSAPWELNIGRRNYEDDRHWIFDGSMDVVSLTYRHEYLRVEAMAGRDVIADLDLLRKFKPTPTETLMVWGEYRGIDTHLLSAYVIKRTDLLKKEGGPLWLGLRASGKPSAAFSYWSEFTLLRGRDEAGESFRAHALDVGATYRFADLPMDPNVTLAYAFGSGDARAGDGRNGTFRQTGQQTNEARYIGLSKFKAYGEVLDCELSNLRVFSLGLGARLTPGISIDFIHRRYQLDQFAQEIRNWALTAPMNSLADAQSKDVGRALDVIVGLRGMFGIRRFGLDLRMGKFFPGHAFDHARRGDPRSADPGLAVVAKFRY